MMTLPQPPRFPSLDSIPDHFPPTTRHTTSTPTSVTTKSNNHGYTTCNSRKSVKPPIHTPYILNYVQTPQNPPVTTNLFHNPPRDNVNFANNQTQYILAAHTAILLAICSTYICHLGTYLHHARHGQSSIRDQLICSEQLRVLRKQIKNLQVSRGREILDYEYLCIHLDIDILAGYKPPKFDIFGGTGDPHVHLRAYYDKLVRVGRNEKLRMKLFIRSLTGEALTCHTHQDPRN